MRFIVLGAGAIGGVVGAGLAQAGHDVLLIARGSHLRAISRHGLVLETPRARTVLELAVAATPSEVDWAPGDLLLIATKSQDTAVALTAVRNAASVTVPVVCLQNGIENERLALRFFDRVYGAVVMTPAAYLEPGVVLGYGTDLTGVIDVGRYPAGIDRRCLEICEALTSARFSSQPRGDVMRFKHAKLVTNLANAAEAICGPEADTGELVAVAREEARGALGAAGIEFAAEEVDDVRSRWERIGVRDIAGRDRAGSSTWQSFARGTGSFETDYLNGEIALLGRQHGVPTPVNELLQTLVAEMARAGRPPGWLSPRQVLDRLPRQ